MIKHKGLSAFFYKGTKRGVQANHVNKLTYLLTALNNSTIVEDMNQQGRVLHALQGDLAGNWSVKVSGNWRLVFYFEDGDACLVDYLDYH